MKKFVSICLILLLAFKVISHLSDHPTQNDSSTVSTDENSGGPETKYLPVAERSQPSIDFETRRNQLREKRREMIAKLARSVDQLSPETRQRLLNGVIKYRKEKLEPLFDSWQLNEQKRAAVMAIISEWEAYQMDRGDNVIRSMNTATYQASTRNALEIQHRHQAEDLTELALAETRLMDFLGVERFKELDPVWRKSIAVD